MNCTTKIHTCFKTQTIPCEKLRSEILALVTRGIPFIRACEIYLVDPLTFAQWQSLAADGNQALVEWSQDIMQAETNFEIELINTSMKNSSSATKLLENRFPQRWKSYSPDEIERMDAQELQKFIAEGEKLLQIEGKKS